MAKKAAVRKVATRKARVARVAKTGVVKAHAGKIKVRKDGKIKAAAKAEIAQVGFGAMRGTIKFRGGVVRSIYSTPSKRK